MQLEIFSKALADQTRLRLLVLLVDKSELCVCEFTQALELSQPKISRHLAILREAGLLEDRRAGVWIYYRLHQDLPHWCKAILQALCQGSEGEVIYQADRERLSSAEKVNQ